MGALVMFALAIIIANVAGIYYWRQDRKERKKGSQGSISLADTLQKGQV